MCIENLHGKYKRKCKWKLEMLKENVNENLCIENEKETGNWRWKIKMGSENVKSSMEMELKMAIKMKMESEMIVENGNGK